MPRAQLVDVPRWPVVRARPPLPATLAMFAALGTIVGAVSGSAVGTLSAWLHVANLWYPAVGAGALVGWFITEGTALTVGAIATGRLALRCPRILTVILAGATFGMAHGLTDGLYSLWLRSESTHWNTLPAQLIFITAFAAARGVALGLVGGLTFALVRGMGVRVVEQTGTLCWRCAYELGDLPRCPECGVTVAEATLGERRHRWRTPAASLAVAIIVAWPVAALVAASHRTPTPFAGYRITRGGMLQIDESGAAPRAVGGWNASAVTLPIEGRPSMFLHLVFQPKPAHGQPPIQLQLIGAGNAYGDPMIVCNLRGDAAESVFANGVPESLIAAIVAAAEEHGWRSPPPTPFTYTSVVIVDPSPHFDSGLDR